VPVTVNVEDLSVIHLNRLGFAMIFRQQGDRFIVTR